MFVPASVLLAALAALACRTPLPAQDVIEYPLRWPSTVAGSTHELVTTPDAIFITGQNMDSVGKMAYDGEVIHYPMPKGSGPHGILLDAEGRLWVSLEFAGSVVRLDGDGKIVQEVDVHMRVEGSPKPMNPHPHGIALAADGKTIWFTGKKTSTVGRIDPDGTVHHFELDALGAVPIYLHAGPDGGMWGTELVGNRILHVRPDGEIKEYPIPTRNSRPIAIKPGPNGRYMWFSEEAGNRIGRVDMQGQIVEFPVPKVRDDEILAGLAFDGDGNLWTQSYVAAASTEPAGDDYVVRIDRGILTAAPGDISRLDIRYFKVPTRGTVMHRMKLGADGRIWFTELAKDQIGAIPADE